MDAVELPAVVGVVGGGRMGAGIAQVFAAAGSTVVVVESDERTAGQARERIVRGLRRARSGAAHQAADSTPDEALDRVRVTTSVADLPAEADLVVEAVPERAGTKVEVLAAAERAVADRTLLATNTSSLSIAELAAALDRPQRFLGMHFFNPVPVSELVELVVGPATAEGCVDRARAWVAALGKTALVVRDSPGFATSRLGVALGLEAIRMLAEGVADAQTIDRAVELGYRHPIGPLRLTDLVGLDVRLDIAEYLHTKLGERFAPPALLREKVARGELGRKTGQGFYPWDS